MTVDRGLPILVVDDYRAMLRIIRHLLKQLGFHQIDGVDDGAKALARLKEKRYGLVISDWNMQPMTGLDLLREVRADPDLCGLPFIMITGVGTADTVVAAREAGVDSYIVKPFTAETLRTKILGVLGVSIDARPFS